MRRKETFIAFRNDQAGARLIERWAMVLGVKKSEAIRWVLGRSEPSLLEMENQMHAASERREKKEQGVSYG